MEILDAIRANLLSPAVLFFALGLIAALTKSDLKFPESLYTALTIYLLVAIGFKGGVAIAEAGLGRVFVPAVVAMLLGALIPLWTYPLLRFGGKFSGSVSETIAVCQSVRTSASAPPRDRLALGGHRHVHSLLRPSRCAKPGASADFRHRLLGVGSRLMTNVLFNHRADQVRLQVLSSVGFWLYQWKELPLAAFAGLKLRSLDEGGCTVILPGGWRTQNPFRSTYFAAQAMAAEMSTGAPAMVLCRGSEARVSMLVTEIRARFTKKIAGPSQFTFREIGAMAGTIERAAHTGEPATFTARSLGRNAAGDVASEFEVEWSFKRRD